MKIPEIYSLSSSDHILFQTRTVGRIPRVSQKNNREEDKKIKNSMYCEFFDISIFFFKKLGRRYKKNSL